jgi:hypothetical protein
MKVAGLGDESHRLSPASADATVNVSKDCVQIIRTEMVEEYRVSGDGIRQDFIISKRPEIDGKLVLVVELNGATAGLSDKGIKILLTETGREFAYSKLLVTDSAGKELPSGFKMNTPDQFLVTVDDTNAIYPIRIDPTISDANWVSMGGFNGVDGVCQGGVSIVSCIASDSNGNVYIAGSFSFVGDVAANGIAKWNGTSWSSLGSGMDSQVVSLALDSSGNLYAGGNFTTAGGISANGVAKWNPKTSTWSALGSGIMNNGYQRLTCDSYGNLYVGGSFTDAGGVPANSIAKWNPTTSTWSALSSGVNGRVGALAFDDSDNLYVGGYGITNAGGISVNNIAKWNGTSWSALGEGLTGPYYESNCRAIAFKSGNLYVGGAFTAAGGVPANHIAKWNPITSVWSALGTGMNHVVEGITFDFSGNIYAGGQLTNAGGSPTTSIAKWNGTSWSSVGTGYQSWILTLAFDSSGKLYAGGDFSSIGGIAANSIAVWNGSAWNYIGNGKTGLDGDIIDLAFDLTGNLYVGGYFTSAGGVPANNVAKWNGSSWSALGSGLAITDESEWYQPVCASSLVFDSSGNLYVGGRFTSAGGVPANSIAKWNGSSWSALGSGLTLTDESYNYPNAFSLVFDSSGNLYVGGYFTSAGGVPANNVAKWNGSSWSALGSGLTGPHDWMGGVLAIDLDSSGNLYVGGNFTIAGDKVSPYLAKCVLSTTPSFTVTFNAGANGSLSGTTIQTVAKGSNCSSVTAVPNTRYHFVNWTGDYTGTKNPLTLTNISVNKTITANFAVGQVLTAVGVALETPIPPEFKGLKVTVKGLPAGLRYDVSSGKIIGVPTKPGVYIIEISAPSVPSQIITIVAEALPLWAQGIFDGTVSLDLIDDADTWSNYPGTATMTVTSLAKITGKLSAGGKSCTFSATSYSPTDEAGVLGFEAIVKIGTSSVPLSFRVSQPTVLLGAKADVSYEGTDIKCEIHMYRNVWKDSDMLSVLADYVGYYTAVLPGGAEYGSGYLAITVDKAGGVKTTGKLADGTALSLSGSLIFRNEPACVFAVIYASPASYQGGCIFGLAEFVKLADHSYLTLNPMDDIPFIWENRNAHATSVNGGIFKQELELTGGWYKKIGNLHDYYQYMNLTLDSDPGAADPVLTVGAYPYDSAWWNFTDILLKPITNSSGFMTGISAPSAGLPSKISGNKWDYGDKDDNTVGLKIGFTRATGIFKGSFKSWFDYGTTHTYKIISYEGVLTPERNDKEDGVEGRGFFLWSDPSPGYPFKWSYDFVILGDGK